MFHLNQIHNNSVFYLFFLFYLFHQYHERIIRIILHFRFEEGKSLTVRRSRKSAISAEHSSSCFQKRSLRSLGTARKSVDRHGCKRVCFTHSHFYYRTICRCVSPDAWYGRLYPKARTAGHCFGRLCGSRLHSSGVL